VLVGAGLVVERPQAGIRATTGGVCCGSECRPAPQRVGCVLWERASSPRVRVLMSEELSESEVSNRRLEARATTGGMCLVGANTGPRHNGRGVLYFSPVIPTEGAKRLSGGISPFNASVAAEGAVSSPTALQSLPADTLPLKNKLLTEI